MSSLVTPSRECLAASRLNVQRRQWTHIPALDGIRGLAALIVVGFHFFQDTPAGRTGLVSLFRPTVFIGQTGVDLFFVLSGFLISGILLAMKGTPRAWSIFYARRALRIFPLYYGVLFLLCIVSVFVLKHPSELAGTWWYWIYAQNLRTTFVPHLSDGFPPQLSPGHFWSLAVEEQFYLFWPVIVFLLDRKWLVRVLLGLVGVSLVAQVSLRLAHLSTFYFTLTRMDGLAMGALLAIVWEGGNGLPRIRRPARYVLAVTVPMFLCMQFAPSLGISFKGAGLVYGWQPLVTNIMYCSLIACVISSVRFIPGIESRPMCSVGKYSYAIYVFHPFVVRAVKPIAAVNQHGVWQCLMLCVVVFLCYVAARISWAIYESRFLSLKRYFEYRPKSSGAM